MISLLQKSNINLPALRTLLDQYEQPCILWDQENDKIIQINKLWEGLTKFNPEDLINTSINNILPKYKEGNYNGTEVINIRNKDDSLIKCKHNVFPLESNGKLVLFLFFPLFSSAFKAKNNSKILEAIITSLLELDYKKGFINLAEETIALLNGLYDSFCSAIYLNSDSVPTELMFISNSGERDLFQKKLDANEFNFQQPIEIWKSGERALNTLQRIAKQKGISELITATFQIDENHKGLLLLSFKNQNIDESDFSILPVLIAIILKNFKKAALFKNNKESEKWFFNNEQYESVFDNASIGMLVTNKENKIIFSNLYIEKLFGYEKWELSGAFINEIVSNIDDKYLQNIDGQYSGIRKMSLRKRDGSIFPAQLLIQNVYSNSLNDAGFQVIFIEDVSELNNLQNEVVQLARQAEMGVLVASFAHDVRNVFNSIKLNADTVQLVESGNKDIKEIMTSIKDDCDEINQLMESVLSFSSSFEKNKKAIDLGFMLERVVERWKPKLDKMKIHSILQKDEEIPQIIGDARSLEQAFNNLISNARDAMSLKGGTLGIYIKRNNLTDTDHNIGVSFSDTGVGIPEENLQKVFDPFFTARPGGTGLGLAITKKIIEYHGGKLEVSSFPGGTTFNVSLPIIPAGEYK